MKLTRVLAVYSSLLILILADLGHAAMVDPPFKIIQHDLTVEITPAAHTVKAQDRLRLVVRAEAAKQGYFFLNKNLKINSIIYNGGKLKHGLTEPADSELRGTFPASWLVTVEFPETLSRGEEVQLVVTYQGVIYDPPKFSPGLRFLVGSLTSGVISEAGVYLAGTTNWYPDLPSSLARFSIRVTAPRGWEVITQGELEERVQSGDRLRWSWRANIGTDSLTLVAGRLQLARKRLAGVDIYTYFQPQNMALSARYMEAAAEYIRFYSNLLGPFPFSKFAIVENFFPSGYGLPSFTLLGGGVIERLYIQPYSLGHEIVHNWFGNYVFISQDGQNWAEGLTTYLANYFYREQKEGKQAAALLRRRMLQEFYTYIRPGQDYPLERFVQKRNITDQAIGYQKGAMVFHMLRRMLGDEAFFQGLRVLLSERGGTRVGWQGLQNAFERASGIDLDWFFHQWVKSPGAPRIRLGRVEGRREPDGFLITINLVQEGRPFRLNVPVVMEWPGGRKEVVVLPVKSARERFEFIRAAAPRKLAIDPDFELFRRLELEEIPPNLNLVIYDDHPVIVLPSHAQGMNKLAYQQIADRIRKNRKAKVILDRELTRSELAANSLLILGSTEENALWKRVKDRLPAGIELGPGFFRLDEETYQDAGHALLVSFKSPFAANKIVSAFFGLGENSISRLARLLFYYGWQSYTVFKDGKVVKRGDLPVNRASFEYEFKRKKP